MPPRKRAAATKKTAAKKAPAKKAAPKPPEAPAPVVAEGEVVPRVQVDYTGPAFPLGGGSYLSTPSIATSSVSKGPAVAAVRKALGLSHSQNYDSATRVALMEFQSGHGLPVTGVVTREVWEALHAAPVAADGA